MIMAITAVGFYIYNLRDADHAWFGESCGFHFINTPHNNPTCLPPFSCRNEFPDAGGTCGF
jgi:hypothetical protein